MTPDNLPKSQEFSSLTLKEKKILNEQADKMYQSFLSELPDFFFDNMIILEKCKNYIQLKKTLKTLLT
ncbi:MAG: hypothetical protein U5K53_02505 [Halanaerobiales bacterium]|nr:hypothetical protein [Halanaerobiales bacterium]